MVAAGCFFPLYLITGGFFYYCLAVSLSWATAFCYIDFRVACVGVPTVFIYVLSLLEGDVLFLFRIWGYSVWRVCHLTGCRFWLLCKCNNFRRCQTFSLFSRSEQGSLFRLLGQRNVLVNEGHSFDRTVVENTV